MLSMTLSTGRIQSTARVVNCSERYQMGTQTKTESGAVVYAYDEDLKRIQGAPVSGLE